MLCGYTILGVVQIILLLTNIVYIISIKNLQSVKSIKGGINDATIESNNIDNQSYRFQCDVTHKVAAGSPPSVMVGMEICRNNKSAREHADHRVIFALFPNKSEWNMEKEEPSGVEVPDGTGVQERVWGRLSREPRPKPEEGLVLASEPLVQLRKEPKLVEAKRGTNHRQVPQQNTEDFPQLLSGCLA